MPMILSEHLFVISNSPLVEFAQCRFENGYNAIEAAGDFNGPFEGAVHVDSCTFVNQKETGVFGVYLDHVWVRNSEFLTQNINGSVGVKVQGTDNASIITGNYFLFENAFLSGNKAIILKLQEPTPQPSLIANNMIAMYGGDGSSRGIELEQAYYTNVYFNTVRIRKTPGYESFPIFIIDCEEVDLLNNNFVAEGSPAIAIFLEGSQANVYHNDYNNYFTDPGVNWLNELSLGPNSHSVDPNFLDDTDLHVATSDLADAGTPLPAVTIDFDGEPRDPETPDIGADEFLPEARDVGVLNFVSPVRYVPYCDGPPEVIVTIKNYGSDIVHSLDVLLEINGVLETTVSWTGTLAYLEEATVNLGTFPLVDAEAYLLRAYTQAPNGQPDQFSNNDFAEFTEFHLPLSGTYTVGGQDPDFNSLLEMSSNMVNAGLCGPTTILIRDGVYDDNIFIDTMPGSSAQNTVLITSESGDSSQVVIMDEFPSPYDQIIFLDEISYVTISHLTLDGDDSNLEDLIRFRRGHDLAVTNCELIGNFCGGCAQTTKKGIYAISIDSNLTVRNNWIYSNSDAFWLTGNLQTGRETSVNFVIEDNQLSNRILILNAARPQIINNRCGGRFSRIEDCGGFDISHNIFNGGFALYTSTDQDSAGIFQNNALYHFEPSGASVSWDFALFLNSTSNVKIFHNTMRGAFNAGALGVNFSSEVEVFNNILYQGQYNSNSIFTQNFTTNNAVISDHNVFFRNDSVPNNLLYRQQFLQQDLNSYFIDPQFLTDQDSIFFPTNGLMNNLAIPTGLETDLFFSERDLEYPDMGAIEYEASPVVDLGPDRAICDGETLDALNPGSTYLWNDGSTDQTLVVTTPGVYWVEVTNALGTASDTVEIDVLATPELMLEDQLICLGDTVILEAGISGLSYLWSTGDTTETVELMAIGEYWLTVENAAGCSDTDTLVVDFLPQPDIAFIVIDESCPGAQDGSIEAVVTGGQGDFSYAWAGSSVTDSLLPNIGTGIYELILMDGDCQYIQDVGVEVGNSLQAEIFSDFFACIYNGFQFEGAVLGADSVAWWVNDEFVSSLEDPIYSFTEETTYTLTLIGTDGICTDTASIELNVVGENICGFCIPYYSIGTSEGDFIDGVVLNQIFNTNTGSTGGPSFQDYTDQLALLERGLSHTITITSGANSANTYGVWLDLNANDRFEPEELMAELNSDAPFTDYDATFTIPADALLAQVRLRVRCFPAGTVPHPCLEETVGETEDYLVQTMQVDAVDEVVANLRVYPNPVSDRLNIESEKRVEAEVLSLDGQVCIPRQEVQGYLEVGQLAAGMYVVVMWIGEEKVYWRVVVL
jgi:hypothetical protein